MRPLEGKYGYVTISQVTIHPAIIVSLKA